MGKFMDEFKDQLKQTADESLKEYLASYKTKLNGIEESNDKLMQKCIQDYHTQRETFTIEMETAITKKLAAARIEFEKKLQNIEHDLFKDTKSAYQQIVAAADELKNKQKSFDTAKRKWNKDDVRIAEYLGISVANIECNDDDEKAANLALSQIADTLHDADPIEIKIDDRTFLTTRGTLTQVKDSFIAKLFGAHHDMMHRDASSAYHLNCNPDTFAMVLNILRDKGKLSKQFQMTHSLYAALLQFEIIDTFFPNFDATTLQLTDKLVTVAPTTAAVAPDEYKIVFKSYRSTTHKSNYFCWNKPIVSSPESKEDDEKYWKLINEDEFEFVTAGWYRVVFRGCTYYSAASYCCIYINGSATAYSNNCAYSGTNYKSFNFNELIEFKVGDKLKVYASQQPYNEEQSSYLCIEKIPEMVVPYIGIYRSSASSDNYREWNTTIKNSDRYSVTNGNKNVQLQKGGLYRVSSRVHSHYSSGGQQYMYLYEYRNGGCHQHMSAKGTGTTGNKCHVFDEICALKKDDYLQMYDGGYGTVSNAAYDSFQIEYLPFTDVYGVWRSNSVYSTYQRKWDCEYWCNEKLYKLDSNQSQITVQQDGYYRISSHITHSSGANVAAYSALYIKGSQYAIARYGAAGATYQHTTSIQEIVQLKKGDTFYVYTSNAYNSKDYNTLFVEKLST